jgi:hypothetical protein
MFQQTFICKIHLKKCIPLFLRRHIGTETCHKILFTLNHHKQQSTSALNISLKPYFGKKHLCEVYSNAHVALPHFFKALCVK